MHGPYADHILDARDVCLNCGRKNRTDRVSAHMRDGVATGKTLDSHLSRDKRRTSREHVTLGEEPAHCETVFCECGVETQFERIWSALDYGQFKSYVKRIIRTLREKRVDVTERTLMEHAFRGFRETVRDRGLFLPVLEQDVVDELLADAVDAAIATATAGGTEAERA